MFNFITYLWAYIHAFFLEPEEEMDEQDEKPLSMYDPLYIHLSDNKVYGGHPPFG